MLEAVIQSADDECPLEDHHDFIQSTFERSQDPSFQLPAFVFAILIMCSGKHLSSHMSISKPYTDLASGFVIPFEIEYSVNLIFSFGPFQH